MNLYILRHTKVNCPEGVCYGQTDVDVLPSFNKEIKPILHQLKQIHFHKIYSSPLKRCSRLASKISKNKTDIIYENRLKELNFGSWEQQDWTKISNTPEAKLWFNDFLNVQCPNGESYQNLLDRTQSFVNEFTINDQDKNILIVTHSGIIRALHSIINHVEPKETFNLKIEYGQIFTMKLEHKKTILQAGTL